VAAQGNIEYNRIEPVREIHRKRRWGSCPGILWFTG
jgi:hypothetical protein